MSTTAQVYSNFKTVTDLLTRLNGALITAKRVVLRSAPPPEKDAIAEATSVLTEFLSQQSADDANRGISQRSRVFFQAGSSRGFSLNLEESAGCLARLQKGLTALEARDLEFLERVARQLDQSSENLYRQMARV